MEVFVAQSAGFCWGVSRAVAKAREWARAGGPIYTDGPLMHNEQMMEQLRTEGIVETATPESLAEGTLIIRAHGISPARRATLGTLPVRLADATCPDVARIQAMIRKFTHRGYHILIYGDKGHAEVNGLLGYAEGRGHVIGTDDDVESLPDMNPVCLVAQSTQFPAEYERIAAAARRRFPNVEVLDSICAATRSRQTELIEIADRVDAIVVVGGAHSANTARLVKLARTLKPTVHVQTPEQLRSDDFRGCTAVGLTAGASTPPFVIEAVRKALEAMEN